MKARRPFGPQSFHTAAGIGLISLAIQLGRSPAARKRNLATLYEAGAISGDVFAWALARHELGAA